MSQRYPAKRVAGARLSDKGSDATTSIEIGGDMSRVKRVRFSNSEANRCSNAKAVDAPKTSEFAFFKKMKEKACISSHQSHKEDNPWESRRESPIMFGQNRSYLRSSLPVEKASPSKQHYIASASDDVSKDLGLKNVEPICKNFTPSEPIDKVEPGRHDWFSPPSGDQTRNSSFFSAKRQKLRQWVVDTSLPKGSKLSLTGPNLINVLLSRLLPENSANKFCRNLKSNVENDIEHQKTIWARSDTCVKRHHRAHEMNFNASEHRPYIDDGFGEYWSMRHLDIDIPELDTICADSPSTSYSARPPTEYSYSRSLCNVEHTRMPSFWRQNDSSFLESFEAHDSIPSGLLKELAYFDYKQLKSTVKPHTLFLNWDVNNEKHEQKIAAPSFHTDANSFLTLETSGADDDDHRTYIELVSSPGDNNEHRTYSELISSPSFPKHGRHYPLLPHYHLDNLPSNDFLSHLGEEKCQSTLTSSSPPKYLKLLEDSIPENLFESSCIEPPLRDYVKDKFYCSLEPFLFPTRLDFISGWEFLSMTDSFEDHHFTTDAFWFLQKEGLRSLPPRENDEDNCLHSSNYLGDFSGGPLICRNWSSSDSKLSHDNDMSPMIHPLALPDPRWDICEDESYQSYKDDDNDEWKYI